MVLRGQQQAGDRTATWKPHQASSPKGRGKDEELGSSATKM